MHPRRMLLSGVALALAVMLGLAVFTHAGRTAVRTTFFLPDAFAGFPVRPSTWFTAEPIVERVSIPTAAGENAADIYRPRGNGRHAAILISMAVDPPDLRDKRLVRLADGLARSDVVVMIRDSERLRQDRMVPEEVDDLVGAFQYLRSQSYVDPARVGYFGISVGGSLAVLAAEDERIRDQIRFVVSLGGYYDLQTLATAALTRGFDDGSRRVAWQPDNLVLQVLRSNVIDALPPGSDRDTLQRQFIDDQASAESEPLSPAGEMIRDFLASGDEKHIRSLLARLPDSVQRFLAALSPSTRVLDLHAELVILHDRGDTYVPYVESRRLAAEATNAREVRLTEFDIFAHAEPTHVKNIGILIRDVPKLYRVLYRLMLELT